MPGERSVGQPRPMLGCRATDDDDDDDDDGDDDDGGDNAETCEFRRCGAVARDSFFLGCDAVSIGNRIPTFRATHCLHLQVSTGPRKMPILEYIGTKCRDRRVKFVLEQAMKTQRGSKRYSSTLSLTSALDGVDG